MQTCFSGMAGGGVHGRIVGIVRSITTGVGIIITIFQVSILMLIWVGEDITEAIIGMGTDGTINGFLTTSFNRIGRAGTMIDIGKAKELGASRTINLDHNNRGRK